MIKSKRLSFLIFLISFLHPNIFFAILFGTLCAYIIFKIGSLDKINPIRTSVFCNSILLSAYLGFMYYFDFYLALLIFISILFNFHLCFFLHSILALLKLPLLSLPFTVSGIIISIATKKFNLLIHENVYFFQFGENFFQSLPFNLFFFFKSIGTFFCIPDSGVGCLIFLSALTYSPLIAFYLISGFYLGTFVDQFFILSSIQTTSQSYLFNYSLLFTAISGVFLIPGPLSLTLACFSILICSILAHSMSIIFDLASLPLMSLPFSMTTYLILKTLHYCFPHLENKLPYKSPESILEMNRLLNLREKNNEIGIFLPFDGKWKIQQGFDDIWTHQGKWKYGYDFVKTENGKTFKNLGIDLEDYHAFGQHIYSPISGYIVNSINHLPDNKINNVNNSKNWGNYILIKSLDGYFVKLAHLKQNSITLPVNSFVEAGQKIAQCGNSGYSQEPHLHLQVQSSISDDSETLSFNLLNYQNYNENQIHFKNIPSKEEEISPLVFNYSLFNILNFKLGEQLRFKEVNSKKLKETIHVIEVRLDPILGRPYLSDGISKLYFNHLGSKFYFYNLEGFKRSILWDLFISAPSIPVSYGETFKYFEFLPLKIIATNTEKFVFFFLSNFLKNSNSTKAEYEFHPVDLSIKGKLKIKGKIESTFLSLDLFLGIKSFGNNSLFYERI